MMDLLLLSDVYIVILVDSTTEALLIKNINFKSNRLNKKLRKQIKSEFATPLQFIEHRLLSLLSLMLLHFQLLSVIGLDELVRWGGCLIVLEGVDVDPVGCLLDANVLNDLLCVYIHHELVLMGAHSADVSHDLHLEQFVISGQRLPNLPNTLSLLYSS